MSKVYLGDGVYCERDEWGNLVLTTENGLSITNTIHLDPDVQSQLVRLFFTKQEGMSRE